MTLIYVIACCLGLAIVFVSALVAIYFIGERKTHKVAMLERTKGPEMWGSKTAPSNQSQETVEEK